MKQALVYIHERAKHLDWKQMAVVHDEIQARVKAEQAEELGQIMVSAIVDAGKLFQLRCPLSGSYKVGRNWADTH
jgi:DNA polymerase I-like protein with 3'-5' exonuclease and polymerase domains